MQPGRVLVVDDQPSLRTLYSTVLRAAGYDVHVAGDGNEALAVLSRADWQPDLALVDIHLPGVDGLSVARWIKRHPGLHDLAVIGISGLGSKPVELDALASGCVAFLTKPISNAALVQAVAKYLPQGETAAAAAAPRRVSPTSFRK